MEELNSEILLELLDAREFKKLKEKRTSESFDVPFAGEGRGGRSIYRHEQ